MVDNKFAVSLNILTLLAYYYNSDDSKVTSEYIASSIKTNPTVIRRHVAQLVKANLVISSKGKMGGLKLKRPPDKITLDEIYLSIQTKPILACSDKTPNKKCLVSTSFQGAFHKLTEGLEHSITHYLKKEKLSDFLKTTL